MDAEFWRTRSQGEAGAIINKLFPEFSGIDITGEATTTYLASNVVPPNMVLSCPESCRNFKFIVLVRDPVPRWEICTFLLRFSPSFLPFTGWKTQGFFRLENDARSFSRSLFLFYRSFGKITRETQGLECLSYSHNFSFWDRCRNRCQNKNRLQSSFLMRVRHHMMGVNANTPVTKYISQQLNAVKSAIKRYVDGIS